MNKKEGTEKTLIDMEDILDMAEAEIMCKDIDVERALGQFMIKTTNYENSKKTKINKKLWINVAKIAAVFIIGLIIWQLFENKANVTVNTFDGNKNLALILPDGTNCKLNHYSELVYPQQFTSNTREVNFKGEAFFEISHNPEKPFIIHINNLNIKVLGTAFNLCTNKDESITTLTVTHGKVLVYFGELNESKSVEVVVAGQMAIITMSGQKIEKIAEANQNNLAWFTGKLVFNNIKLGDAIFTINKLYNSNLEIKSEQLKNCLLTATFDNQPLTAIIEMLKLSFDIEITEGEKILLYRNGCN